MKAFIVNRVGDFGFLLGIFLVFVLFGSRRLRAASSRASPSWRTRSFRFLGIDWHALTLACLLLFMGAMGKSAQFLLHTWLPDAMEGPTPVSALIHAATMVTAGVFMVARLSPLFEYAPDRARRRDRDRRASRRSSPPPSASSRTTSSGSSPTRPARSSATCSSALGVGAYGAGIFHLFTHAFFKALLFLGAGSVIHAMHHEQDMRNMGALRRYIPFTTAMMAIGTLALTGFPFTAGYFSKDAIIEAAYASHRGRRHLRLHGDRGRGLHDLVLLLAPVLPDLRGAGPLGLHGAGHARRHMARACRDAHQADGARAPRGRRARRSRPRRRAGLAQRDHEHGTTMATTQPHESPLVMLIPLARARLRRARSPA